MGNMIATDRRVKANRSDNVLFDKLARTAVITDAALLTDDKLRSKIAEKGTKY